MHQVKESGTGDNGHMNIPLDAVMEDHAGENTSAQMLSRRSGSISIENLDYDHTGNSQNIDILMDNVDTSQEKSPTDLHNKRKTIEQSPWQGEPVETQKGIKKARTYQHEASFEDNQPPSRVDQDAAESGAPLGRSATLPNNHSQVLATANQNQNNSKDMYRRFSQKHDPKWAAMIALLAHGEVDEAIKKIEEQEEVMRKEKQQQGSVSKDYIVG